MAESTTVTTPIGKHKVEIKSVVTGLDQEIIDREYYIQPEGKDVLPAPQRANRKSLEILVLSVDGKTENTPDACLAMDLRDYNFVIKQTDALTKPPLDPKKNETSTNDS